ncbi:hypothetical protein AK812_SmicGene26374 [Symbiodinium microadriaticum]|uniref:Uncharacterized protein n=1 Tax=Symbiodinium microadriaticum TaxID=2951 RepID=A0A1Q9D9Q2_SYMMI|nr:hypothetical protein AK812_SmicGene26374 [Symbiodinium microadriaticum]
MLANIAFTRKLTINVENHTLEKQAFIFSGEHFDCGDWKEKGGTRQPTVKIGEFAELPGTTWGSFRLLGPPSRNMADSCAP